MKKPSGPRFSERAVAHIEDFDARHPDDAPLRLWLQPSLWWGNDDRPEDAITYDGPNLCICGRDGTAGSATLKNPVTLPVGGCEVVMSPADYEQTKGIFVDLLPLSSSSGNTRMFILALI